MSELDSVVLVRPLTESAVEPGDVGAIVHDYGDGKTFEVEFTSGDGRTVALLTLSTADIRPLSSSDRLHVREVMA